MANIANNPLDDEVLTCRAQHCNNLGNCVIQNGERVCECILGYRGDACEDTVNDGLAVPLTLGVLGFIIGFVLLVFALALLQQKRKKFIWGEPMMKREVLKSHGNFSHMKIGKREFLYI